jgi:hypothetical protein
MKLLNTFAFASVLGSSVLALAACGGSSSNPAGGAVVDSGTTPTDGGASNNNAPDSATGTPAGDAGTSADAAPGCSEGTCGTGQVCCQGQNGSSCIAEGATCQGLAAQCQNSASCSAVTAGQVCCGTLSIATESATSACQAGPCASGSYQLCTVDSECSGGQTCQPITYDGFQLPIASCQAPTDGGTAADVGTTPFTISLIANGGFRRGSFAPAVAIAAAPMLSARRLLLFHRLCVRQRELVLFVSRCAVSCPRPPR